MYTHDFIELHNPDTGHSMVTQEFSDDLFYQGYRFVGYVPNSQIDFPEQYAKQQEDADERLANCASDPMIRITEERISGESMYHQPVEIW